MSNNNPFRNDNHDNDNNNNNNSKRAQVWVNVSIPISFTNEQGEEIKQDLRLPLGIPVDSKSTGLSKLQRSLYEALEELAKEGEEIPLRLQPKLFLRKQGHSATDKDVKQQFIKLLTD